MPLIKANGRVMQDGTKMIQYTDTIGPSYVTYTLENEQELLVIANKGVKPITFTVGTTTATLNPGQSQRVETNFTSFQVKSSEGIQQFEVRMDEVGTEGIANVDVENLDSRMDSFSSQLAQKANQDEVQNNLNLKRDKSIPIGLNDADSDLLSAIQGGTTVEVLSIPRDYSVTPKKTDFLIHNSINLFDSSSVFDGYYIDGTHGGMVSLSGYSSSDFIPVVGGKTYAVNVNGGKAFYDANKQFIIGNTTTAPPDAYYFRFSTVSPFPDNTMMVEGTTIPSEYQPFRKFLLDTSVTVRESNLPKTKFITPEVTTFINKVRSANYFNKATVLADKAVSTTNGSIINLTGYSASDFIEVEPSTSYVTSTTGYKAFYDSEKNFISSVPNNAAGFTTPSNAKYVRITVINSKLDTEMLVKGTVFPSVYTAYHEYFELANQVPTGKKTRRWEGKKWAFLGDSISTKDYTTKGYWEYANEIMLANPISYGISSTEICTSGTFPNPFIERYINIDPTSDLITVFGGTNDFGHNATLGTIDSRDNATFYGALHNLCIGLHTNFTNAQFAFFTPIPRVGGEGNKWNSNGNTLLEFVNAIKEVCGMYSIPVLDLYHNSSIFWQRINDTYPSYMTDYIHPNAEGHKRFGYKVSSFLESL